MGLRDIRTTLGTDTVILCNVFTALCIIETDKMIIINITYITLNHGLLVNLRQFYSPFVHVIEYTRPVVVRGSMKVRMSVNKTVTVRDTYNDRLGPWG